MMSRGVTFSRADGFRPGLLPECHRLADLTETRARELLGCSDPSPTAIPIPRVPFR